MILRDFIEDGVRQLSGIYDNREARNILSLILEEKLGLKKVEIARFSDSELDPGIFTDLNGIVKKLKEYEPVQYILGECDFYGLKLKVNRHVLIPRPETEELVDLVIKTVKASGQTESSILDIGTGSGCIPIALKKNMPALKLIGMDISREAILIAQENAALNEADIEWVQMDFLNQTQWKRLQKFDVIISNPPYVAREEMNELQRQVKDFEPLIALTAHHTDPLIFYKKIAAFAPVHLHSKGKIFLELNSGKAEAIAAIFRSGKFTGVKILDDMQGRKRILMCSLAETPRS